MRVTVSSTLPCLRAGCCQGPASSTCAKMERYVGTQRCTSACIYGYKVCQVQTACAKGHTRRIQGAGMANNVRCGNACQIDFRPVACAVFTWGRSGMSCLTFGSVWVPGRMLFASEGVATLWKYPGVVMTAKWQRMHSGCVLLSWLLSIIYMCRMVAFPMRMHANMYVGEPFVWLQEVVSCCKRIPESLLGCR